jgi:hypothetical protein
MHALELLQPARAPRAALLLRRHAADGGARRRASAARQGGRLAFLPRDARVCAAAARPPSASPPPEQPPVAARLPSPALLAVCLLSGAIASAAGAAPASAAGAPAERRHARDSSIRSKLVAQGKLPPRAVDYSAGRLTIDAAGLKSSAEAAVVDGSAAAAAAARSLGSGVSRTLADARSALSRPPSVVRGRDGAALRSDERSVVVVSRGAGTAPALQVVSLRPRPRAPANAPAGWALLALAVGVLFLALRPGAGRRAAAAAGVWVRDRSLGGRLVRVTQAEPRADGAPGATRWKRSADGARPAGASPLDDAQVAAQAKRGAGSAAGRRPAAAEDAEDATPAPAWWSEPAPAFAGASRRAAGAAASRAACARLNAARVGGRVYDPADFLALRAACSDAGAPVEVSSDTARDALFRGAVEAALTGAVSGPAALTGLTPGGFLTGLAGDLRVPRRRAAQLVAASTAARLRGGLLDCLALLRRGEQLPAALELSSLGAMLRALPMAPSAPELDLVATSMAARSTHAEREQLAQLCVAANGEDERILRTVRDALGAPLEA